MNNSKLLAGILSLVLIAGVGSPAFADNHDVVVDTTAAATEVIKTAQVVIPQCGDVELMFVLDDTGSMGGTLVNIGNGAISIVNTVEAALIPGADASYGVITFKDNVNVVQPLDTDETLTIAVLGSLVASGGAGSPEASDMAKQTAIDALPAGVTLDQDGAGTTIIGGMTVPYSTGNILVTKVGILITDNPPGGGNDAGSVNDDQHLSDLGDQSDTLGIVWHDLIRGTTSSDAFFTADAVNSGGTFTTINTDGTGVADAIIDIITDPDFCVIGGEMLQIDSTALLLAGLQGSVIWMLPVLAGAAGVGAYYIKTRMNKD